MKHSFLRLISSFYILLISALMIVISAYAWMVISDSPAAGGIGFGIAGLEQWGIPEEEYKEPAEDAYDYMDAVRLTAADVANGAIGIENGVYIIDSAEKFVALMEYVNGNTAFKGPLTMRLMTHISLEDHKMQSQTVEIATVAETLEDGETETSETQETITETVEVFWKADEWNPVWVSGYYGTGYITIEVDESLKTTAQENGLNATAYIKGLAKPLFYGGFAGKSGIVLNDVTIYDSHMVSNSSTGSGSFIEYVDSMTEITLKNCHFIASSIDKDRTAADYPRVGGLIGWTAGYDNTNDGSVETYITVENCSVQGCTLVGSSVGGINGHAGANAWTYTTIKNCTVKNNTLHSMDDGDWRVGEIVGTANIGQVTIIDAVTENNVRLQTGKTEPKDRPSLYGRASIGSTGSVMILDNDAADGYGEAYVIGEFIPEKEQALTAETQRWYIHGAVKLKEEVQFNGKNITVMPYQNGAASITFESVATGLSYPGSENASAGFNFVEMDGYTTDDMDKVRAEKGSEINFTKITFINNKTLGTVATNVASRRHPICMYALADTARYEECVFEGSLVVYNSADFIKCRFTEDDDRRYCLFFDDVYDPEDGTYLIQECTFTAASTAYGCVKISEDGSLNVENGAAVGGTYRLYDSTFINAAHEGKPAVYINGYANIITDGNNTIVDNRENWDERAGGILAKHLTIQGEDYNTYATYQNTLTNESRICLTTEQYKDDKTKYDTTEFGVNGGDGTLTSAVLNADDENGETESTSESTSETAAGETTASESTSETAAGETTSTGESETVTAESTPAESTPESVSTEETSGESKSESVETESTESGNTEETTPSETASVEIETPAEDPNENAEQGESQNEPTETEEIASESTAEETEAVEPSEEEITNEEIPSSESDLEDTSSESSSEEENAG